MKHTPPPFSYALTTTSALLLLASPLACDPTNAESLEPPDPIEQDHHDHPPTAASTDPSAPDPAELAAEERPMGSQCGNSLDYQDVESYDGTLGPSTAFVDAHERPVAQIRWRDDLAALHDDPGNVGDVTWCTGTMVSRNMLLTAGHCFDMPGAELRGWDIPRNGGALLTAAEAATSMVVELNYQDAPNGTPRTTTTYEIVELLEWNLGGIDYAVVEVEANPGVRWGATALSRTMPNVGDALTIIQHPAGIPEVVDGGTYDGEFGGLLHYDDIDTLGGSSGSGVLDDEGEIVGVHVQGGCDVLFGANKAEPIDEILAVSDVLDDLVEGDIPLAGDLDGDGNDEMIIWRPTNGRWYAKRSDGSRVFPQGSEPSWGVPGDVPLVGDMDGDGDDEMVIWRPSSGRWYAKRREGTRIFPSGQEAQWGVSGDVPLMGDMDGDGDDEMVIWRPSSGRWYGLRTNKTRIFPQGSEPYWGVRGDVPMLGDIDGDGADDMILWRPSTYHWYAKRTDGSRVFPQGSEPSWGTRGDIPRVADLDGDGADDMILWRSSNGRWYGLRDDGTRIFPYGAELNYGIGNDVPLVGDYDGDGTADAVIWRPSNATWWARRTSGSVIFAGIPWGFSY
ncbi:MAG: serine protease [Myxococcota bacterium]